MALKHRISLAAANFGCDRFRITPNIVSKLLRAAVWSRCAVRFESEQTPIPQTGRRFRPAALDRIGSRTCSFVPMSYLYSERPMTDRKIERSDGRCFDWQQLLANSIEIFISHEKKSDSSRPEIYKALKPYWLLNWVSITRVVACFPQASRSRPAATAADSETPCVCACPSDPRKQSRSLGELPQELGRWYCPSNSRLLSGTAFGEIARWPAGAQTWTQTWTLPPHQRIGKVLSPPKSQHKL